MKILFFYENKAILDKIDKSVKMSISVYMLSQINQIKDAKADFLILETSSDKIEEMIDKLELNFSIPYIIISKNIIHKYHGLYLVDVIEDHSVSEIKNKMVEYFKKIKSDEFSIFELPDVMQMVAMERKDIAIRIFSSKKDVGAIAFKKGRPIYAKSITKEKTELGLEAALKMLSWDNIKFKLVKVIGEVPQNLDIDLTNLLMGAMQYKDEQSYINENKEKDNKLDTARINGIIKQLQSIVGYLGLAFFKDNKKICDDYSEHSSINSIELKDRIYTINKLITNIPHELGTKNFKSLLLSSEFGSTVIEHDSENNIDGTLFLKKNSNIPLSKVMMRKVMINFL